MLAVVMAGGKGTRLRPLTCDRPKPMVPVGNRPLLEHVLRHLYKQGWTEQALTLCYMPEKVEAYFGGGEAIGTRLHYFVEDQPKGTAGSVKLAADLFQDTLLVASGDALTSLDLRGALAFHRERDALVTIVLARVESPLEYGVVLTGEDGRIIRFLEKPGWGEVFSDTVNTGFYLVEPEIFDLVPEGEAYDFSRNLFPRLLAGGERLFGYTARGYWSDVGTLEQYMRANLDLLAGRVGCHLREEEKSPGIWVGEGAEIDPGAEIMPPVLLGSFCRVGRGCRVESHSIVGDYGYLAAGSSLKRSVLWRHVYIGQDAEVRGGVLSDHVILRDHAAVHEGAVLGEGCQLGSHGVIHQHVKLWPGKRVESGGTVRDSMVWNDLSLKALFGNTGVSGVANLEITPEMAAKLGASYAAALGQGRHVAVACDGFPIARLLKRAVTAGLLGAGLNVRDLGTCPAAVVRFAVGLLGMAGGIHLGLSTRDNLHAVMQFLDERGLPVGRQTERAIEQSFYAEDFPRMDADHVGELAYAPGMSELYLDGIRDLVDAPAIRNAGLTVVVGPLTGPASELFPGLLDRLGCRSVPASRPLPGTSKPLQREELLSSLEDMASKVRETQAGLAATADHGMEELILLDSRGRRVSQVHLATLMSLAELRRREGARLPIAVTASEAINDLARDLHGTVVRTKSHRRFLLEEFASMAGAMRGLILPAFDALYSLGRLLELMANDGRNLAELVDRLPSYERVETAVACTWQDKGRLIRRLIEENRDRGLDLTDGIRLQDERGWVLILPDGEEPLIRVYSEAGSAEEADALNRYYVDRILANRKSMMSKV